MSATTITPEDRTHFLNVIRQRPLPEGWLQKLLDKRPSKIESVTGIQHVALCDLADLGLLSIANVTNDGREGFNSRRTFMVKWKQEDTEPQMELQSTARAFDL